MNNQNNIEQLIDAYAKGKLSGEKLQEFEQKMAQDEALNTKAQQAKALHSIVMQHKLLDVKQIALKEELKLREKEGTFKKAIVGGAIVTALLVMGTFYFISPSGDDTNTTKTPTITSKEGTVEPQLPSNEEREEQKQTGAQNTKTPTKTSSSKSEETITTEVATDTAGLQPPAKPIKLDTLNSTSANESQNTLPAPCEHESLTPDIDIIGSCSGKSEGAVNVKAVYGGQEPYKKELYSSEGDAVSTENLLPGTYSMVITDVNNCIKVVDIEIPKKACPIDDHFNPSLGELWNIPMKDKDGTLKIYTKAGTPILEKNIESKSKLTWDGQTSNGLAPTGYYIFVINYTDGTVLKGSITITQ